MQDIQTIKEVMMYRFLLREDGQATTEYVLIIGALVLTVIATLGFLGQKVLDIYDDIVYRVIHA